MCCRGQGARRGFGPRCGGISSRGCGQNRGFIAGPEGAYEHRPGPRGLFGIIAAKRAEKKADRERNFQPLPDTKQSYYESERGFVDEKGQQQGQYQWEDETPSYQNSGFQNERSDVNVGDGDAKQGYQRQGTIVRNERPENSQVSPPRYSMVMRE